MGERRHQLQAFGAAVGIIEEQLDDVRSGTITESEMENTRRGLIRDIEMMRDQPSSLMDLALTGIVNGCPMTAEHLKQRISQVSVENVMKVARGIQLDTVYFLRDEEGARHA